MYTFDGDVSMRLLALVHGRDGGPEVLGDVIAERGHELEEVDVSAGARASRPLEAYGAALVMGGVQHADEDERYPWLLQELEDLRTLAAAGVPVLGVCLGAQLAARALGGSVGRAPRPEIGWFEVERTAAGAADPLFTRLPERFPSFHWHYYTFEPPPGAVELARNDACTQAFRVGNRVWGVQFHPEVRGPQLERWLRSTQPSPPVDPASLLGETARRIAGWNRVGRTLASAFLDVARS